MKPPKFEYLAPASLVEAKDLLHQYGDEAKILAGGQSLMPLLNMRLVRPGVIVDINRISDLDYISAGPGGGLAIGALTRQRTVERSGQIRETMPLLAEAMPFIGHFQTRNRGTIGGSMAHCDPAAELPALSLVLEAELVLAGAGGERVVRAEDFFDTYLTTALTPDELLTEMRIPALHGQWGWGFEEVCRRQGDFAMVGAVSLLQLDDNETCRSARITMFGVGQTPARIRPAEEILIGQRLDGPVLTAAAQAVSAELEPDSDIHASAEYRKEVGGVLAMRTLKAAMNRLTGEPRP